MTSYLQDEAFAAEFLRQDGLRHLVDVISESTGNMLAYGLSALQVAIGYNIGLDNISADFVDKVRHKMIS